MNANIWYNLPEKYQHISLVLWCKFHLQGTTYLKIYLLTLKIN